ncbi:MAG: hypothetical protein HY211_01955 [Candidatus Omnitrophica bacterium]|nr:hypothetical protein [Candidatus Omnitrophota bacterium]
MRVSFVKYRVTLYEYLDGRIEIGYGPYCFPLQAAKNRLQYSVGKVTVL